MRGILSALLAALVIWGASPRAEAQDTPVVVELYTSQGCSSCPPADALLAELSVRDDVIPLALHVDYWDYIGWKDSHADPAHTVRQRSYARAAGHRTIYTPQMIVGGRDHVVGYKPMKLAMLIDDHRAQGMPVRVGLTRQGGSVVIQAEALREVSGNVVVQLVRYRPSNDVKISRGENAGRTLTYTNIVTDWTMIGGWDGTGRLEMRAEAPGDAPVVVVLQETGHGPILGAARLR